MEGGQGGRAVGANMRSASSCVSGPADPARLRWQFPVGMGTAEFFEIAHRLTTGEVGEDGIFESHKKHL